MGTKLQLFFFCPFSFRLNYLSFNHLNRLGQHLCATNITQHNHHENTSGLF